MFEILLPATAKATVGKVIGTALDRPLGKLAEQVHGKVEAQPLAVAVRAVQSAVEAARQELIFFSVASPTSSACGPST